jgi:translation initiation factor IF-1
MELKSGDRVVAETESTERPARKGPVEEVVGPGRFRIRWEDGHESVLTPAAGSLHKVRDEPRKAA